MVWGWVHNFPALKDVFTKPIDYPDEGYDTQIADWWQDGFDASEAIQEYLLAREPTDAGDTAAYDFDKDDFVRDGALRSLDLSPIIGTGKKLVRLRAEIQSGATSKRVWFFEPGNTNTINSDSGVILVAGITHSVSFEVITNVNGRIRYKISTDPWTFINVTVRRWESI